MPEFRECLAHYLFLLWLLHTYKSSYILLGLWADLTDAEVEKTGKARNGLVQRLTNTCTLKRGSLRRQTPIYPPTFNKTKDRPIPPSLETLELKSIDQTSRAIILNFGVLYLKLSYLTHTSIQFYKHTQWETSVVSVPKALRGKIGLALEFKEYILAFISNDLVFQPEWELLEPSTTLYVSPPLYTDYTYFLKGVAGWIESRAKGQRQSLACEVMRSAQQVWGGVGVYTVCELFFDAGISPFLAESEVFDCPSRTARLCEAFFAYAYRSYVDLPALLKAATVDGVLAPTQEQRLKYMNWLHVYAKDKTRIPRRMNTLLDAFKSTLNEREQGPTWYRDAEDICLHDVFDPLYLRDAFEKKEVNLGHLIFGDQKWQMLGGRESSAMDPLSEMFIQRQCQGDITSATFLNLESYSTLYPSKSRSEYVFPSVYAYTSKKQIWSIVPQFSENSYVSQMVEPISRQIIELTDEERRRRLFRTIVTESLSVAIGPLEYSGNGRIVRLASGKKELSLSHSSDPSLSVAQVVRQAKHKFRHKQGIGAQGKSKKRMTESQRKAQKKFVENTTKSYHSSQLLSSSSSSSSSPSFPPPLSEYNPDQDHPHPQKKQRICQDKHILHNYTPSDKENAFPSRVTRQGKRKLALN